MSISPQKTSISQVSLGKNPVKGNSGGINKAIKSNSKNPTVAKSSDTAENQNEDSDIATEEESTPSETTSKEDAGEVAKQATTRALASMQFDLKKFEIDTQRQINLDNIAAQKAQMELQMQNSDSGVGPALASMGLQTLAALGQAKGGANGGGSSGGSGAAKSQENEEGHKAEGSKAFEDQKQVVKLDAHGNPINKDPNNIQINGAQTHSQATTFQTRPIDHGSIQIADAQAQNYDSENALEISSHDDMRSNQVEDIDFDIELDNQEEIV